MKWRHSQLKNENSDMYNPMYQSKAKSETVWQPISPLPSWNCSILSQAKKGPLRILDLRNWDKISDEKLKCFHVSFSYFIQIFPFEVYYPLSCGWRGSFWSLDLHKCLSGLSGPFRSLGDRTTTREVVGTPLAFLIKFKKWALLKLGHSTIDQPFFFNLTPLQFWFR